MREEGLQGVLQTLRDAKAYGADSILVVPGVVNEEVNYQAAWERSIAELKKAVPLAKELGVKISIENVWNNFILSPIEAVSFLDEVGDPIVGWHFDIGNVLRYGWPEHWIPVLGKRINRIHVKEYSTKKMKDEGVWKGFDCDLTQGDNNWPAIMKALDGVGYTGWAISEQRGGINPNGLKTLTERMDKHLRDVISSFEFVILISSFPPCPPPSPSSPILTTSSSSPPEPCCCSKSAAGTSTT
jgi:L-ribulose-5-phosphate 3-epimerase